MSRSRSRVIRNYQGSRKKDKKINHRLIRRREKDFLSPYCPDAVDSRCLPTRLDHVMSRYAWFDDGDDGVLSYEPVAVRTDIRDAQEILLKGYHIDQEGLENRSIERSVREVHKALSK